MLINVMFEAERKAIDRRRKGDIKWDGWGCMKMGMLMSHKKAKKTEKRKKKEKE